tara:strand:- start:351 stop:1388 length:1038 start_codon:yes stop_codon:yes gene_type:complete
MKGNFMNRSKLIGATALASVMAAGAAHSEMAINGYFAGTLSDADGGGMSSTFSTNSIYVSYSDSMDNGMGVGLTMSVTAAGIKTDVNFDTGMGTIGLGIGQDSAVDSMDSNPACFSLVNCWNVAFSGKGGGAGVYDDGDGVSGNSIAYSNSMGGVSFKVTRGMETDSTASTAGLCHNTLTGNTLAIGAGMECDTQYNANYTRTTGTAATEGYEATMSYAASASFMGATIKAGVSQIDYKGATADKDPNFMTVGYSIAGLNLGYAMYDSDDGSEETHMGVGTSVAGMDVGVQFADRDFTTDTDYMRVSVNKGMGAASFGIDYLETDVAGGSANDTDKWVFNYVVGF